MIDINEKWKFDVLGIYDHRCTGGGLDEFFRFIRNRCSEIPGDIVEMGVFRGRSLISLGLLMKELSLEKHVWGYDSFGGFPSSDPEDNYENFRKLWDSACISREHWERVCENEVLLGMVGRTTDAMASSTSGNFSETSAELVQARLNAFGIAEDVTLVPGRFQDTLRANSATGPTKICCALVDCDLYSGYQSCLPFIWERLSPGGLVFLDEYYSLKFPGARIATDQFCEERSIKPTLLSTGEGWERWGLFKLS